MTIPHYPSGAGHRPNLIADDSPQPSILRTTALRLLVCLLALTLSPAAFAQDVPFKVLITELVQLDSGVDPIGKLGDYYAKVTINGVDQNNKPACGDDPNPFGGIFVPFTLFSNFARISDCSRQTPWSFEQQVPAGEPVSVKIQVFDSDSVTGDDEGDAKPGNGKAINLDVDPFTGRWSGDFDWPQSCGRNLPFHLGNNRVRVCWQVSFDTDGDGLLDVWELSGIDSDNDGIIDVDLPAFGADPQHKDLFVEFDWMPGEEPRRSEVQEWIQAFAAAPVDAGGISNPDGLPGINLWIDTGALTDLGGVLVGHNFGGGNAVPFANVSNLNQAFYQIKAANFASNRELAFRYGLSSAQPANDSGTSTGDNTATMLNDTNQNWITDEWILGGGRTLTITGGTGEDQKRTIVANTATQLTVDEDWDPIPDATSTYEISRAGGWGEGGGNDFLDYNHNSSTLMHELGHNLNLGHGGGDSLGPDQKNKRNCKPNYVSVMNYDHDRIFRLGAPDIIDYSPPEHVLGGRSNAVPPDLDENVLNETVILDPDDPDNLFVFVAQGVCQGGDDDGAACVVDSDCELMNCEGFKILSPLNAPVDWNGDDDTLDADLDVNIDTSGAGGYPTSCANNDLRVLEGHDDWSNISLPFIEFGNAVDAALNLAEGPEPTLEERLQLNEELNTANLGITQTAPATVEVGDSFDLTLAISNDGPNPALAVEVVDSLPPSVTLLSYNGDCEEAPGLLTCDPGAMLRGAEREIDLVLDTDMSVCVNGLPILLTNNATAANVAKFAGADRNPSDNTSSITVTPVDTTAPVIESLTADSDRLWPPNHKMVPVTVSVAVADLCDSAPACRITGVTSNETVNGRGDGKTSPDWEIVGDLVANLRAERSGTGDGRVYTLTTQCRDASGNSTTATVEVVVPHSKNGD